MIKAMTHAVSRIEDAFKNGGGILWGEHDADLFVGTERFFRPGYAARRRAAGRQPRGARVAGPWRARLARRAGIQTARKAMNGAAPIRPIPLPELAGFVGLAAPSFEEMEAGMSPSYYSNLVPSVFHVYIYIDDLERLRPLELLLHERSVYAADDRMPPQCPTS